MYKIVLSVLFQKQAEKLFKGNGLLKRETRKTIGLLWTDLKHPSLRLHKLKGDSYWSISVNKSIRIIARWDEDALFLLRIGTHDEVY